MPLSGLTATEYAPEARYRRARDRPAPAAVAPAAANDEVFDAAYYGRRFKTDLSQLKVFSTSEEPPPQDGEADSALIDFFGHLSLLLVAVRAGDIARAQAAADALELDALVEFSAGRLGSGPMLGDLVVRLSAPPPPPSPAPPLALPLPALEAYGESEEDGGAAYDTLAQYLDGEAGAG